MLKLHLLNTTKFNKVFPYFAWPCGIIGLGLLGYGLFQVTGAPEDYLQGIYAKIMYIHVPSAWLSLAYYAMLAISCAAFLISLNPFYDIAALALATTGVAMTLITLITGAIWGKPTWGTWWVWDARLTSVLILFFIYAAYLTLRFTIERARAAKISAIFAIVGLINLPIIKFSVYLWNTLHQPSSVFRLEGPTIHPSMLYPLLTMFTAILLLTLYSVLLQIQIQIIKKRLARS
jgi:heme exporter protein C